AAVRLAEPRASVECRLAGSPPSAGVVDPAARPCRPHAGPDRAARPEPIRRGGRTAEKPAPGATTRPLHPAARESQAADASASRRTKSLQKALEPRRQAAPPIVPDR